MDIKEIIKIFGLAEDATEEDVRTALKAGAQAIDDLAAERARAESSEADAKSAKYDRLANEANFDESKHPRAGDGKFTSGGGGGGSEKAETPAKLSGRDRREFVSKVNAELESARIKLRNRVAAARVGKDEDGRYNREPIKAGLDELASIHRRALLAGLTYSRGGKYYNYE